MKKLEDLTTEELQSCLQPGIDLDIFKRVALTTERLMPNSEGVDDDKYVISEGLTASLYCKEIMNTFSSAEHSIEWETEFNVIHNAVEKSGFALNDLLKL